MTGRREDQDREERLKRIERFKIRRSRMWEVASEKAMTDRRKELSCRFRERLSGEKGWRVDYLNDLEREIGHVDYAADTLSELQAIIDEHSGLSDVTHEGDHGLGFDEANYLYGDRPEEYYRLAHHKKPKAYIKQDVNNFRAFFLDRHLNKAKARHAVRKMVGKEIPIGSDSAGNESQAFYKAHRCIVRVTTLSLHRKPVVVDRALVADEKYYSHLNIFGYMKASYDEIGADCEAFFATAGSRVTFLKGIERAAKELHRSISKYLTIATWDFSIDIVNHRATLSGAYTVPRFSSVMSRSQKYWSLVSSVLNIRNRKGRKNRFILNSILVEGEDHNRVRYEYSILGNWDDRFMLDEDFVIEYPEPVDMVPKSILVIPLLANILPLSWLKNAIIELPQCDADFYDCIPKVKKGYKKMYPLEKFKGELAINHIEKNQKPVRGRSACLFSGGLDAYTTLIRHAEEKPELFMMFGADVGIDKRERIDFLKRLMKRTSKNFDVSSTNCESSVRMVLRKKLLDPLVVKDKDTWWHGFECGIGILSHYAPMAWLHGVDTVYIASSFTKDDVYTCASDPTIDNHVRYCGARVIHDGYELSRIMKVELVANYAKEHGYPDYICSCLHTRSGKNCCFCEKCIRTILGIYACGYDPKKMGFTRYGDIGEIGKAFTEKGARFAPQFRSRFMPIRDAMCKNYRREDIPEDLMWLYDFDFEHLDTDGIYEFFMTNWPQDIDRFPISAWKKCRDRKQQV